MNAKLRKGILQYLGIKHHEYWSWWLLVIPVWPLWIWYGFRLRCATWFTAVNPGMEDSGFVNESKIKILDSIPIKYKPHTLFVGVNANFIEIVCDDFFVHNPFPLIAKPDIGGRGRKVVILKNEIDFEKYHHEVGEDYMLQEIIPYELEMGVFYIKMPDEKNGRVTSIALKEFMQVIGDGEKSIKELMNENYRFLQQIPRMEAIIDLNKVPSKNEKILLEPIGNHCRGTAFIDGRHLINQQLNDVFTLISNQIDGFYYGRFDIRVKSLDDLYKGKNIYIMELNGLTSDAVHIFDPNSRLRDAYFTQIENCKISYHIAKQNLKKGVKPTPLKELIGKVSAFLKAS